MTPETAAVCIEAECERSRIGSWSRCEDCLRGLLKRLGWWSA